MSSIDDTLQERGSRYGEFTDHAELTQNIKAAMYAGAKWNYLEDDQKECLEMVAHKVGRILNGDPDYIDSWTDIGGYVRLVEKRLIAQQAAVKELLQGAQEQLQEEHDPETCPDCQANVVSIKKALEQLLQVPPVEIAKALSKPQSFTLDELEDLAAQFRAALNGST